MIEIVILISKEAKYKSSIKYLENKNTIIFQKRL